MSPRPERTLVGAVETRAREQGVRNTANPIAAMAQVGISYMSTSGGSPGINFGAKAITSRIGLGLIFGARSIASQIHEK